MFSELFLMSSDRRTMQVTHKLQVCLFSVSTADRNHLKNIFSDAFFPAIACPLDISKIQKNMLLYNPKKNAVHKLGVNY